MRMNPDSSGGRFGARRFIALLTLMLTIVLPAVLAGDEDGRDVRVHEQRGVYSVVAEFEVPQPPPVVLAVLTDYEQIPRFMPGVETSRVRERDADHTLVEQEAVSRVMMFSKRVHLLLDVTERADGLQFRDRCGRSFVRYEGAWRLSDRNGGTRISYELTAQPSFDVPGFLLKRLLKRDSAQMIGSLRREIGSRALSGLKP